MIMKRRFITRNDNTIGYNFEGLSLKNIVVREISPVDEFYFEQSVSSDDARKCTAYTDPIRMLFNQERLSQLGSTAVDAWLSQIFSFKSDPLAELRSKCSDDDLKKFIKDRNLQQPSEIMAWCEYMRNNMNEFESEYSKYLAKVQTDNKSAADNNNNSATIQSSDI